MRFSSLTNLHFTLKTPSGDISTQIFLSKIDSFKFVLLATKTVKKGLKQGWAWLLSVGNIAIEPPEAKIVQSTPSFLRMIKLPLYLVLSKNFPAP